jgi:short-subunit dehydrogenase
MKDKVVIITGASSGIGLAFVYEFASMGAKIVMAARSIDKLQEISGGLKKRNIETLAIETDVSKEEDCKNLIEKTIEQFGRIDILINNAGISMRANFKDVDLSVLKKLMDVNFWGTVYCTKYALPYLLESKGSLVGISSIAGYIGLPGRTGYSASKFAMNGFLETVRNENLHSGFHVLIAAPGFTASNVRKAALTANGSMQGETPRVEEKMMTAEEVAHKIVRAIKRRKDSLILTIYQGKATVFVNKLFPKLVANAAYHEMLKEPHSPFSE